MKAVLALLAFASTSIVGSRSPAITPAELSDTVKEIASDAYQGRAPGTAGEDRTIAYLVGRLKTLGLAPAGPGGSWTQTVPMIHDVPDSPAKLEVTIGRDVIPLVSGQDIAPTTTRATDRVKIDGAPLVFVGYGVSAPDREWDDFKDVDLHGKVAVFLVNDPDFEATPSDDAFDRFGGKAMTYYGRWTYKYEEAARRGAIGALLIHDKAAASYGWNVASATVVGGTYALPVDTGQPQPPALQAWISQEFARRLFARSGLDLDVLSRQARSSRFRPMTLANAGFSIDMAVKSESIVSHNVLAKIPGSRFFTENRGGIWRPFWLGCDGTSTA